MKYRRTKTPERTDALLLALNWFLTDQDDIAGADEYQSLAEGEIWYTQDEVEMHGATRYVGRFRTSRLKQKRAEDLRWRRMGQLVKTGKNHAT